MCETYNGWTNRETWALNLWLTNDQGLYEMTRERVAEALLPAQDDDDPAGWLEAHGVNSASEAVKDLYDELTDPSEGLMTAEAILSMVKDVGSDYRVDWDEIGAYWLTDVTENPVES